MGMIKCLGSYHPSLLDLQPIMPYGLLVREVIYCQPRVMKCSCTKGTNLFLYTFFRYFMVMVLMP